MLLLGLSGCGPVEGGGFLAWTEAARTAVVAVRPEGVRVPTFAALDGADLLDAEAVRLPRGGEAAILGLAPPLSALQLEPGRLALPELDPLEACDERRVRPFAPVVLAAVGGSGGWVPTSTVPDPFGSVGLPPLDVDACYRRGGCPDAALFTCRADCRPVAEPRAPAAPAAPALPARCPSCPAGEAIDLGRSCAEDARLDLEEGACVALGRPCPDGPFPPALPDDPPTLHLDPAAIPGGDGRRGSPFTAVGPALDAASPGTRVLLARGAYAGDLVVDGWLEGACPGDTTIRGRVTLAPGSTLAEVGIRGDLHVQGGAVVTLRGVGVRFDGSGPALVLPAGSVRLQAEALSIEGPAGVAVGPGSVLELARADLRGAPALEVFGRATVDALVARGAGAEGPAVVRAADGGSLGLDRSAIRGVGLRALDVVGGGELDARDLFLEGGPGPRGLTVLGPGSVARVERLVAAGFLLSSARAVSQGRLEGRDLTLLAPPGAEPSSGHGLEVVVGAAALDRVAVSGPFAFGAGLVGAVDVAIRDLAVDGALGGVHVHDAASARMARVRVDRAEAYGLRMTGSSSVTATDLTIVDVAEIGIVSGDTNLDDPYRLRLERAQVTRAGAVGVQVRRLEGRILDLRVDGGPIGVDLSPSGGRLGETVLEMERISLRGQDFGLFLARLNPNLGRRIRGRAVDVQDCRVGVVLRSCWPDLGALLHDVRIRGARTVQAIELRPGD